MVQFEGYERRIKKIEACMKEYGFGSLEEVKEYTVNNGVDVDTIVPMFSLSRLKTPSGLIRWALP